MDRRGMLYFLHPKMEVKFELYCISASMDKRKMLYFHHLKMKVKFDFYGFITCLGSSIHKNIKFPITNSLLQLNIKIALEKIVLFINLNTGKE